MKLKRGRLSEFRLFALCLIVLSIFILPSVSANLNSLNISITEDISEVVSYDGSVESDSGTSHTNLQLRPITFNGTIVIKNVGTDILSNINVSFNQTDYLSSNFTIAYAPSYTHLEMNNVSAGVDRWIYLRQLVVGDNVTLTYTADAFNFGEPINITETFSTDRIMLGDTLNISINVTNSLNSAITLENVILTKEPQSYIDESGFPTFFNYTNLAGPDAANVDLTYTAGKPKLVWNASNKDLTQGESVQIWFDAVSPLTLNESELGGTTGLENYLVVGNVSIEFTFNGTASGLTVSSVDGNAMAAVTANKQLINTTHWRASVNFSNVASSLDYNLTSISVWATNYSSGNILPDDTPISGSNVTWYPNIAVTNGSYWNSTNIEFAWQWVPIIWVDATLKILDDGTQIKTIYEGRNTEGGYTFIEEIYVLKGYFIKATKRIIPAGNSLPNIYNVSIVLENLGTSRTPEWLSAFDLVPPGFSLMYLDLGTTDNDRNVSDSENNLEISNSTGGYEYDSLSDRVLGVNATGIISDVGSAYYNYSGFHVDLKALYAGSNGDSYYDAGTPMEEIEVRYQLNGTGDLSRIQNVYVVGVDPVRVVGAKGTSEIGLSLDLVSNGEFAKVLGSIIILMASLIGSFIIIKNKK
ncbi:hypothetical protein JXM83_02570 [Candidatus Woesearchaeota archaeon]|nr:hypothetical protein [Candidatus Woesearchaeota archaeon]